MGKTIGLSMPVLRDTLSVVMKKFLLVLLQISLLCGALPVHAADSGTDGAGFILSDQDLTDANVPDGFSQRFLEAHGGAIAGMKFPDVLVDGSMKKPGDLIDEYGRIFGVNPRYLLALIQKEQSLVDDRNPSPCQINWAAGYGRPDGTGCYDASPLLSGFSTQIMEAAAFVQCFYHDSTDKCGQQRTFGYFPGATVAIDDQPVTFANVATAALYSYTPHLHGNLNLKTIWTNWFTLGYPDGSVLSSPAGEVYLIQGGLKRRFANKGALATRVDPEKIIPVTDAILTGYQDAPPIQFANYSLLRVPDGTVYLLDGDVKRPIQSMAVFRSIGFNPMEVDDVAASDLDGYLEGDMITLKSAYPTGALLQDKKTHGVYLVENGKKSPIFDMSILTADYAGMKITPVTAATLAKYAAADPVRFRDGDLVTGSGADRAVYVISNGQKRPIVSGTAFEQLGYSWKQVIRTTDAVLALHPLGPVVTGAQSAAPVPEATLASAGE